MKRHTDRETFDARSAYSSNLRSLTVTERVLCVLLFINATLGAALTIRALVVGEPVLYGYKLLAIPILGAVAIVLMFRCPLIGLVTAMVFYLLQSIAYFAPGTSLGLRAGLDLALSLEGENEVYVVNVLALLLSIVHGAAASSRYMRLRRSKQRCLHSI